ncbi:HTTM domain protein [Rhodopirellula maiorica SM1]|uniref:HTTM domain protein n=2 Tax=Novipirellula TaxID=2795426 RepID=M5RFQ2_9BACT|nr:HTTM domain protein [Rhodopirellula maiorica SM1]
MSGPSVIGLFKAWLLQFVAAWDRFWFTPRYSQVLAVLRIVTGGMLFYSHLVLAMQLSDFLGDHAWINNTTIAQLHDGAFGPSDMGRSYLWHLSNPLLLWLHHAATLTITAAFAIGFMTRVTAPAAWFLQIMYIHRLTGSLFGLDQIVTYTAMYLMLTPSGSCFSVDAWLRERFSERRQSSRKFAWLLPENRPSVAANVGTRLLQLHLCVIYLFGGLAKARGELWWDGTAIWFAVANYEYQSMNMTWIGSYPRVFSALTHLTLFWEVFYCALVWPRLSRPVVIAIAILVHGGIATSLGMATFGLMMIAANCIFVEPKWLLLRPASEPSSTDVEISTDEEPHTDSVVDDTDLRRREEKLAEDKEKLKQRVETLKKRERKVRRAAKKLREQGAGDQQELSELDEPLELD